MRMSEIILEVQTMLANARYLGDGYIRVCASDVEALQVTLREAGIKPKEPKGIHRETPKNR